MATKLIDLIESVNADDLPTNMFTIEDKDPMVILGKLNEVIAYLETLQATINASDSKANEALQKSIHLVSIAAVRINEQLNRKLSGALADEDITSILTMMDAVSKRITEIPALTKALGTAYENLRNEEEEQLARGGKQILSSMDADDN